MFGQIISQPQTWQNKLFTLWFSLYATLLLFRKGRSRKKMEKRKVVAKNFLLLLYCSLRKWTNWWDMEHILIGCVVRMFNGCYPREDDGQNLGLHTWTFLSCLDMILKKLIYWFDNSLTFNFLYFKCNTEKTFHFKIDVYSHFKWLLPKWR